MASVLINPEDWKAGNPIYYGLALGNDVYTVLNAGHGYSYDLNTAYALTSPTANALRFEVRSGDQNWFDAVRSNAERSEIASNELIRPDVPVNVSYGFELAPGDRNTATDAKNGWFIVGQLIQDTSDGQAGAPPAMSINMVGEKMTINVRFRDASGNVVTQAVYQDANDIQRGHHYDMDVKAVFGADGNGRLVITRDGVTIVDYAGKMGYTDTKGVYWKEGIYRSAAAETAAATYCDLQISHGDMVKIPAQGASYIGATAPTLQWNDASKLAGGKVGASLSGTAAANSQVQIYNGEKLVGTTKADASGHFSITIPGVSAGSNIFTATSTGANGQISKVSGEVVVEIGTAANILTALDQISHKQDLKAVFITDAHVFTVASLAQMKSLVENDQNALSKIVGDFSFQFWSGAENNRTLSRYDEKGVFTGSYNSTIKNGVLTSETYINADPDATYAKQVYQYNITGKAYTSSYQAFDADGRQVYATTTYGNGKLASVNQLDDDGTLTVKAFDTAGLLKSTSVTQTDGTVTITSYDAAGRTTAINTVNTDKSVDLKFFSNGVLTSEQITHAPGDGPVAKEVILYNIANSTYTTIHQNFSANNQLLTEFRTRADGTIDTITWLASDGTTRSKTYDASNRVIVDKVTLVDKSIDTKNYKDGVIQRETIVKADGSKEVYDFNVFNRPYGTVHTSYDSKGKVIGIEYLAPKEIDLKYAPPLPSGTEPAPTLALAGSGEPVIQAFARTMARSDVDHAHSALVGNTLTAALTGTAGAGSTVLIYDNGRLIGTALADSHGNFSMQAKGLGAGSHVLSASTLSSAGKASSESGKVAVQVTTAADFLSDIRSINGLKNLAGVWLTDGNVITVPAGKLAWLLATYDKAFDAIQGDHTFEMWSGMPGSRTVSRYDAAGTLFEKETRVETNGVLVRKVVEHVGASDVAKEIYTYNIAGKAHESSYQSYDGAGKLVASTNWRGDGSLLSTTTTDGRGESLTTNYDATQKVVSTIVTKQDGSSVTSSFSAGQLVTSIEKQADGSSHSKAFTDGVLTSEVIVHAPGGAADAVRETYVYGIKNQSYVTTHSTFDAAGNLTASERLHTDGSLDWAYRVDAGGRASTSVYDAAGKLMETRIVNPDGPIARETYRFDISDTLHMAEHKGYDSAGRLVLSGHQTTDGGHDLVLLAPGLTVVSTTKNDTFDSFGGDNFKFEKGFGHDTILDFRAGTGSRHDTLIFEKGMFSNDNPLAAAKDVGGDVVITTLHDDTVTLHGIQKAALVSVDFLIV